MRVFGYVVLGLGFLGAGVALSHLWYTHPAAEATAPAATPASDPAVSARLDRIARSVDALETAQGALHDDVAGLYDEVRPAEPPALAPPELVDVEAAARADQDRFAAALTRAPRDAGAEEALRDHLATAEVRGLTLDVRDVRCSDRLCRLELGNHPGEPGPDPVGLLMASPGLGGELIITPSAEDPEILVVLVGRDGAALSG